MKIMDMIKDSKAVIALAVIMIGVIGKTYVWASDVSKAVEKMAETQEMVEESKADLQKFIMDLWKIDPTVRDKWSKLPTKPDSTKWWDPWYEFEVNGLVKYKISLLDMTGVEDPFAIENFDSVIRANEAHIYADTIYWHKWEK